LESPNLRFARGQRLLKPGEFKRVFDRACRSADKHLTVLAAVNLLPHGRLGLAISKKNVKLAVQRNRIKRLVRESFRHHQDIVSGYDVVVMVRRGIDDLSNAEITAALHKHWRRIQQKCAE
jgi:ribonuclease P protein component